jgi:hypothetical protein
MCRRSDPNGDGVAPRRNVALDVRADKPEPHQSGEKETCRPGECCAKLASRFSNRTCSASVLRRPVSLSGRADEDHILQALDEAELVQTFDLRLADEG